MTADMIAPIVERTTAKYLRRNPRLQDDADDLRQVGYEAGLEAIRRDYADHDYVARACALAMARYLWRRCAVSASDHDMHRLAAVQVCGDEIIERAHTGETPEDEIEAAHWRLAVANRMRAVASSRDAYKLGGRVVLDNADHDAVAAENHTTVREVYYSVHKLRVALQRDPVLFALLKERA